MSSHLRVNRWTLGGIVALVGIAALLFGCNGNSASPTEPGNAGFSLISAQVVVGGRAIGGQTLPQGHGAGESTRFEARTTVGGSQASGATVWMEFDRPQGMGMSHHQGRVELYDDGTHGDHVAGDGLYCLEDSIGEYGCGEVDAGTGEYHYEFFGRNRSGHETNHMLVTVTITGS